MVDKSKKKLIVRDSVHGDIELGPDQRVIIDHRLFQRLRGISQNGLLYLVYPGMRHSRFEHSIGAAHLAGKWFDSIMEMSRPDSSLYSALSKGKTEYDSGISLLLKETHKIYDDLIENREEKKSLWRNIVVTAGLLHDIGHGPFSHTLEHLDLLSPSGFSDLCTDPLIKKFIQDRAIAGIEHEDISIVYCDVLFTELSKESKFFSSSDLPNQRLVAALISSDFRKMLFSEEHKIHKFSDEDLDRIRLFSHLISGLFDVDRQDYLHRDSKMAGVHYGLVEHKRVHTGVLPVLIDDNGNRTSGLLAKADRVHTLDHFLVGLYEMYTQVYYHPTNGQIQHEIWTLVKRLKEHGHLLKDNFGADWHQNATDYSLIERIDTQADGTIHGILRGIMARTYRADRTKKVVHQLYGDAELPAEISSSTWELVEHKERPIIKDGAQVWLIDSPGMRLFPWDRASMVASELEGTKFLPRTWWRNEAFLKAIDSIPDLRSSKTQREGHGQQGLTMTTKTIAKKQRA